MVPSAVGGTAKRIRADIDLRAEFVQGKKGNSSSPLPSRDGYPCHSAHVSPACLLSYRLRHLDRVQRDDHPAIRHCSHAVHGSGSLQERALCCEDIPVTTLCVAAGAADGMRVAHTSQLICGLIKLYWFVAL